MPSQQPVWRLRSQGPAAVESWKNVVATTMCMDPVQRVGLSLSHTHKHVPQADPVHFNAIILKAIKSSVILLVF